MKIIIERKREKKKSFFEFFILFYSLAFLSVFSQGSTTAICLYF